MLRFNFAETRENLVEKYLKPELLIPILLILLALVAGLLISRGLEEKIAQVKKEIARLEREKSRLKKIQREEKRLIKRKKALEKKLMVVSELEKRRYVPRELYFFGDEFIMKNIWLDVLKLTNSKISVKGNIWNVDEFPEFLREVNAQVGNVLFKKTERALFEDKKLKIKLPYYKFEFQVERGYGTSQ